MQQAAPEDWKVKRISPFPRIVRRFLARRSFVELTAWRQRQGNDDDVNDDDVNDNDDEDDDDDDRDDDDDDEDDDDENDDRRPRRVDTTRGKEGQMEK